MRTAIVHEWITGWVGSEKVTGALAGMFPAAPVYVTVYDAGVIKGTPLEGREIRASFLQGVPGAVRFHRWLLGLMPVAVEQHDLSEFELVISSSHAVAHGAIVPAHSLHVCYCHTPMRYAWDLSARYAHEAGRGLKGLLWRLVMHRLRVWDEASSSRVDAWVANSRYVAERVRRWYGVEDVAVVHPPVAVERFDPTQEREGFYLVAGRLVGYKRVDLAVRACAETGRELVVAGDGPERKRLEAVAAGAGARVGGSGKGSIRFIGAVDDGELAGLMGRCKGLIFAGEEDFGIVPVEAQAAGAPVIGLGRGGLTETVVDGSSGVLFAEQSVGSVADALERFEHGGVAWDAARTAEHAAGFSGERFEREMRAVIDAAWAAKRARIAGPGAPTTEHGQPA